MDKNQIIKLKDVEFVGIGNFEGETVFFDKKTDKLFLGHSSSSAFFNNLFMAIECYIFIFSHFIFYVPTIVIKHETNTKI